MPTFPLLTYLIRFVSKGIEKYMKKSIIAITSILAFSLPVIAVDVNYIVKTDSDVLPVDAFKESVRLSGEYLRVTVDQDDAIRLESTMSALGVTFEKDVMFYRSPAALGDISSRLDVSAESARQFNDPLLNSQSSLLSGLNEILGAMEYQRERKDVVNVLVLDSGSISHSDVVFSGGYNYSSLYLDGSRDQSDYRDTTTVTESGVTKTCSSGHGLQMSGIIGAEQNNALGIAGIADVNLYMARVVSTNCFSGEDEGLLSDLGIALEDVLNGNDSNIPAPDVVNMSLAVESTCPGYIQTPINNLVASGAVVVVSAGNNAGLAASYAPANCENVIVVGSHNNQGDVTSFSNTGPQVDVSVNGIYYTTSLGNSYESITGTSSSTSAVSGIAALIKGGYPNVSHTELEDILKIASSNAVLNASCGDACGEGILNALSALKAAESLLDPVISYAHPYADDNQCLLVRESEALSSYMDTCNLAEASLLMSYAESVLPVAYSYDVLQRPAGSSLWYGNSQLEILFQHDASSNRDKIPLTRISDEYDYAVSPCFVGAEGVRECRGVTELNFSQLSLPASCL
jgi:subtilisin family serine protease